MQQKSSILHQEITNTRLKILSYLLDTLVNFEILLNDR